MKRLNDRTNDLTTHHSQKKNTTKLYSNYLETVLFPKTRCLVLNRSFLNWWNVWARLYRHIDSMFASELITLIVFNWSDELKISPEWNVKINLCRWVNARKEWRTNPRSYEISHRLTTEMIITWKWFVIFGWLNCSWSFTVDGFFPATLATFHIRSNLRHHSLWTADHKLIISCFHPTITERQRRRRQHFFPFKTN